MIRRATAAKLRRRGAVAVVVTICLIPLIGAMAFAIDGGLMLAARRRAQTVADAAAYAAACQLYSNLGTDPTGFDVSGKARAAASSNASANGFNNDGTTNTVTINIATQVSNPSLAKPGYVEVVVIDNQARIFGAIFGSGTYAIGARAVARGMVVQASGDSILVLDPLAGGALSVTGGGTITNSGGVQVNSSNSSAATASGGGTVKAPTIKITGNYDPNGSNCFQATTGPVMTAAQAEADPLSDVPPPDPSLLPTQSPVSMSGNNSAILSPGVYDGGISLSGSSSITLRSGIYFIKNSGFSLTDQASVDGSAGVMIYMNDGSLSFSGGSSLNLTPMTTGPYAGLIYYQNPSDSNTVGLSGGSTVSITGTVYAPGAHIGLIVGPSTNQVGSQFIGKTMSIAGQGDIDIQTTSSNSARTRSLIVVE